MEFKIKHLKIDCLAMHLVEAFAQVIVESWLEEQVLVQRVHETGVEVGLQVVLPLLLVVVGSEDRVG